MLHAYTRAALKFSVKNLLCCARHQHTKKISTVFSCVQFSDARTHGSFYIFNDNMWISQNLDPQSRALNRVTVYSVNDFFLIP